MSYFIFVNSDNKKCLYLYMLPVPTPMPPNFRKKYEPNGSDVKILNK